MLSLSQWEASILNTVCDTNAVGCDARLSDEFDALQQEISHDLSLEGNSTDWTTVLTLSHDLLTNQSKDLLVLVYSLHAVTNAYRYDGLSSALTVLNRFIVQYWPTCYPPLKRKRARSAALEWFAQTLEAWVACHPPEASEKSSVASVLASIEMVNQSLKKQGAEGLLDLFLVTRSLNEFIHRLPDESAVESVAIADNNTAVHAEQPASTPSLAPVVTQQPTLITDEKSYNQCLRDTQGALKKLAKYRLDNDLTDYRAYEMNRLSVWLPVSELPQHKQGVTPLRPLSPEKKHHFDTLLQQQQYDDLIVALEGSLSNAPFWLDGHRMVVESLKAIDQGADTGRHQKAIETISTLTKSFIERLKGIENLRFSDETPFADESTLLWLGGIELTKTTLGNDQNQALNPRSIEAPCLSIKTEKDPHKQTSATIFEQANAGFKASGFSTGFSILDQYCREQTNKKTWYQARLLTINFCFTAKEYTFAEQLLLELDEVTQAHQLDLWEPEMVSDMLSMMLVCQGKLKRKQISERYYQRLVRVDALRGYEMKSLAV